MPDKMITPEISQAACEKDGAYFMHVPDRHKTLDLCRIACKSSYGVLDQLPSWLTDEERSELYGIATEFNASALAFIPDIFKTYDMCKQACLHLKKGLIIKYLPEHLNTEELQALYKMACISSEGDAFQYIPDDRKTDELYQLVLNMWTSAIKKNCMAYFEIPGRYRTTDLFNIALEELTPEFINNLTEIDSVSRLPYIPVSLQFKLLTNAKTSTDDKLHLIDLIEHINYQPHTPLPSSSCITTTSPLVFETRNQHLNHLIIASYRSIGFEPENISRGHEIDNYGKLKTTDILPTHFPEELSASNNQHQIMVGGRTIQITSQDKSGKNIYFKFQRKGEKLQELVKEGFIYEYIQNHPEIQRHFNSELPTLRGFMKIPLDFHLEAIIKNFPDPVDIHEDSGQRFINVFSYAAPPDYSKYAYLPDSATDQPCKKPEQGILDACHDVGFLASMGLILTSMLPAFHDTATVRRWVALHNAFNERNGVHPGTFGAWNTDATGKPDFGHCGIRDIGDYELFGQIKSILQYRDTNDCTHTCSSTQNLALANAICENILAALLIRSRLRQQFEDYHYQNPEAVAQTARFIESVCNEFLSGFNTSISSVNPPENYLKKMLQVTDADYQQWLQRAAQELVYWTGLQPGEEGYESFRQSLFNHNECYLNHIEQGKLSTELYPEANKTKKTKACFYNINGRLNLGAHNSTFPLITLLNGLTRGVTAQLMRSATHSR
ncbi:hypothetical protein [Endozoicomonas sp. ONNA2]|uniref:hypothetical protein n=1 Tax=Endozoicomonas sp. ONNA2 TaxID=2828741 RepID=UPI0021497D66|nr:hypothetical protein [Endozoicomonas sp. ONNA2]